MLASRLDCFNIPRPPDITKDQWDSAKNHAERSGRKLAKEVERSCFYYFLMDDSWEDVASKLNLSVDELIYTAVFYKWHDRKRNLSAAQPKSKIIKADSAAIDLVSDALVATTAVYKQSLADVITDPEKAQNCPLIPKNFKDLETLIRLFQLLQPEQPGKKGPQVNVNIANVSGAEKPAALSVVNEDAIDMLPAGENEEDRRIQALKLLQSVVK